MCFSCLKSNDMQTMIELSFNQSVKIRLIRKIRVRTDLHSKLSALLYNLTDFFEPVCQLVGEFANLPQVGVGVVSERGDFGGRQV